MLSSLTILQLTAGSIVLIIFSYAAYWALSIRRALAVKLYRSQALGVGLISLGWVALNVEVNVVTGIFHISSGEIILLTYVPVLFGIAVFTFYWVDSSARAARRSDPLVRDTFHWSKVRKVCWGLILAGFVFFGVVYGSGLEINPTLSLSWVIVPLVAGISGVAILPLSAYRSKDATFRRHLKWFGVFVLFELILTAASAVGGLLPLALVQVSDSLITSVLLACGGYALFRSARSLVPLNRISLESVTKRSSP